MPLGRYLLGALFAGVGSTALVQHAEGKKWLSFSGRDEEPYLSDQIPTRAQQLSRIRESSREKPFDLLIIGGGATGAGCATDAATRGIKTVLVEREDFASGTSSRSTKLVHGGVRYLEKAFWQLDLSQLKLVWEALHERRDFLANAPHLAHPLAILTPCYKWWEVPYYWAGLKAYDVVAGSTSMIMSRFLNRTESLSIMPTLATQDGVNGAALKGSILYYDGQFDDARMAVTLACTAAAAGAVVANHFECKQLLKNDEGMVVGAKCSDTLTGEAFDLYAKVVINATGPFLDGVRSQSDPAAASKPSVTGSSGTHVTLPAFYGAPSMGLIIPKTKDGRVLFMIPWLDHQVAGTTDAKCDITPKRQATEDEVQFILDALSDHLGVKVRRGDVLSAWSGIRPLPVAPTSTDNTQNVVRDHVIFTDQDGIVNVTGGKWTTYRRMAEEAVDAAVSTGRLPQNVRACHTQQLRLVGAREFRTTLHAELAQQFQGNGSGQPASSRPSPALDSSVANHLARSYGDRAALVVKLAQEKDLARRLSPQHPILEGEVAYCVQHEYCETVDDFLQRRTRLAFLDAEAALAAVPRVADIMAAQLGWSRERKAQEVERTAQVLKHCFYPKP